MFVGIVRVLDFLRLSIKDRPDRLPWSHGAWHGGMVPVRGGVRGASGLASGLLGRRLAQQCSTSTSATVRTVLVGWLNQHCD